MPITRNKPLAGPAPHPGEVLKDELTTRGLSPHALALALRLPASRISQIVRGQRAITPETALQLERVTGIPATVLNALERNYREALAQKEEQQRLKAGK